jgi:hypothetical protein
MPITLESAFAQIPKGWEFDIRSGFTVELWRHDKTPLAETGFVPIREHGDDLAQTIYRAANIAIAHDQLHDQLRRPSADNVYVVICRDAARDDLSGARGPYIRATRQLFDYDTATKFAATFHPSREPRVVSPVAYLIICEGFRE